MQDDRVAIATAASTANETISAAIGVLNRIAQLQVKHQQNQDLVHIPLTLLYKYLPPPPLSPP